VYWGYCQHRDDIYGISQPWDPKLIDRIAQQYAVCVAAVFGAGAGSVATFMHLARTRNKQKGKQKKS